MRARFFTPWWPFLFVTMLLGVAVFSPAWALDLDRRIIPRPKDTEEGAPIHIQADSITYDRRADQYVAEGNVEITRGEMTLRADRVVLDNRTRTARAEGNVVVVQRGDYLRGDEVEIHLEDETGYLRNATLFFQRYNLTVQGKEIQRLGPNQYRVVEAFLSTCSGERPDWRFAAKEIELTVEGIAKVRHATFQVRNLPILYLPYLSYPALVKRKTGFLFPSYYSSSRVGQGISVPFFWAFHESWDATFTQTYFTKRGYQQGIELRYAPLDWIRGRLYGEYIRDQEDPDSQVTHRGGSPRHRRDRWRFQMEQEAELPWGIVSKVQVDTVSDNYYLEDFSRRHDERYLRYLTSTLNATLNAKEYLLAGEAEYYRDLGAPDDDNRGTPQKLPSLLFHRERVPFLGTPLEVGWDLTFDHFWREKGGKGEVLGLWPTVSFPLRLGRYFNVVPFGGWEERIFFTQEHPQAEEAGWLSRYIYGVSLTTELSRVFSGWGGSVQALRHSIHPEIRFEVSGHMEDGKIPRDFLGSTSHDRLIRLVLDQFLSGKVLTRKGAFRYRELGRIHLEQPISLREAWRDLHGPRDEREPFRPLEAELEFRIWEGTEGRKQRLVRQGPWTEPRKFLYANFEGQFDWYDHRWDELAATLRGGDARGDEMTLSYRWVRRRSGEDPWRKQIRGSLRIRTLPILDLIGYGNFDHEANRWLRYGYALELHPSCWAVRFWHSIEPGFGNRRTDQAFGLRIYLLGLGPVLEF